MQISMNQGTVLSERNWLTEGCHPRAWKMMDPICKLLSSLPSCPSSPPLPSNTDTSATHTIPPTLVIEQGSQPVTLLANSKRSGKIGTLATISSDCQGAQKGPVRFQWWQDRLTSQTLFFHLPFISYTILWGDQQNETNIYETTNK